jgi:hypothetical protein
VGSVVQVSWAWQLWRRGWRFVVPRHSPAAFLVDTPHPPTPDRLLTYGNAATRDPLLSLKVRGALKIISVPTSV